MRGEGGTCGKTYVQQQTTSSMTTASQSPFSKDGCHDVYPCSFTSDRDYLKGYATLLQPSDPHERHRLYTLSRIRVRSRGRERKRKRNKLIKLASHESTTRCLGPFAATDGSCWPTHSNEDPSVCPSPRSRRLPRRRQSRARRDLFGRQTESSSSSGGPRAPPWSPRAVWSVPISSSAPQGKGRWA